MTNINQRIIISLLGLPGSGKGTQAEFLISEFNASHISIGELVREEINSNTPNLKKFNIKEKYDQGIPQDDSLVKMLIQNKLINTENNIIFDNYPFSKKQAEDFFEIIKELKVKNILAINIKISKKTSLDRISSRLVCKKCGEIFINNGKLTNCSKCGTKLIQRSDDKPNIVNKRLMFYIPRILEVRNMFTENARYLEINGENSINEVKIELLNKVNQWKNSQKAI